MQFRKLIIAFLFSLPLCAAPPTLGTPSVGSTLGDGTAVDASRSGTLVKYTSTPASYGQVHYGPTCQTTLTDFPYQTKTMYGTDIALQLSGLKPNTTYYYKVTGRPNSGNATDQAVSSCSSFTTRNETVQSPTAPSAPSYIGSEMSESGFTTIPISEVSGACKASAGVTNPGGWTGNISSGDSIQTILNAIGGSSGGVVMEISGDCHWPSSAYTSMPTKSDGSPWLRIRCAYTAGQIPPYGSRIDPAHETGLGCTLLATSINTTSLFFDADDRTVRKVWFGPLHMKVDVASGTCGPFVRLLSTYTASIQNLKDIVFDRVWFEGDTDCDMANGVVVNGNHISFVGNYIHKVQLTNSAAIGIAIQAGMRADGGPYYADNNFIQSVGANVLNSDQGTDGYCHNDHTWKRNTFTFGVSKIPSPSGSGGFGNSTRNPWEIKCGHRVLLQGNRATQWYSTQSSGSCFFLSSRGTGPHFSTGISDVDIQANICDHGKSGIELMNGNPDTNGATDPEPQPFARARVQNNLLYSLSSEDYCPGGGSYSCGPLGSDCFASTPGVQDLVISGNTCGPIRAKFGPGVLRLGATYNVGNYLSMTDNVFHLSRSAFGGGGYGGINGAWDGNGISFRAASPALSFTTGGTSPPHSDNVTNAVGEYDGSFTSKATWSGNTLIGGEWESTWGGGYGTMDASQFSTFSTNWPAGDTKPSGASMAARQSAAGLNTTTWECSCGDGINRATLMTAQGRVTGIGSPVPASTSVALTYTSPDTRACMVRFSSDGGTTWGSYQTDGGGSTSRTPTFTGLASSTTYDGEILCYYPQVNDGEYFTDYAASEITAFSFTTEGGVTKTIGGGMTIGGGITF
jgi:hypothetical protein